MRRRPSIDHTERQRRLFDGLAGFLAATPRAWSYAIGVAVALVALSTLARAAAQGAVGYRVPFQFYYLAVTLAAVLGAWRAAAVALAGSAFAGVFFFGGPRHALAPLDPVLATGLLVFIATAGLEALIAVLMRSAVVQLRDRDLELRLIADELRHRVKNVLALVQSVSRLISRTAGDVPAFQAALEARVNALAGAHDLLARSGWAGAGLRELIGAHLNPFVSAEGPRLLLEGDDLTVDPNTAMSLSLVLHELATNAVKYGCLSTPKGELRLSCRRVSSPDALILDWLERGGPKVEAPARKGFGATLIARTLVDGRIEFEPEGLHVIAAFPLREAAPEAGVRPRTGPD